MSSLCSSRRGKVIALSGVLAALVAALFFLNTFCPTEGITLSAEKRAFVGRKNRAAVPGAQDFDARVTLDALLQPGDDDARWDESRAAAVEGYVVAVGRGGVEAANCFSLTRRDTHIYLASRPAAPPRQRVVAEVTPRMRAWAEGRGLDWSEAALSRELVGRWCRVEGWLLFDREHAREAENTAPGGAGNWRATAWEIHPVTGIKVVR